ncbi:MAG: ATP-binding cassette domain-containing protein [Candidatus Eisenbacteria bacterium]|nr:ATP-binding cassette domain-containing protein [Candidatus Latescibacterota bacterium]MBD3301353.1 ATP-binding cassette domain-containing protein [Candidatus Eisenbacteria bacterium]
MDGCRLLYGGAVVALVLGSCFLYLVPMIPQATLDGVLAEDPSKASPFVRDLVDRFGGREHLRANLWIPGVAILALTTMAGVFTYLRGRWSAIASEAIARKVRDNLYDQLQHLPCRYHDRAETGDQVQRCTSDVDTFRRFLATQVVEIGRAIVMMLVPIPLMLALDVRMTIVSVVTIPPIVLFSFFFFRRVQRRFQRVDEAEAAMTSTLQENLTGIRVVRAFARQDLEIEKFEKRNGTHRGLDYQLYRLFATFWGVSDFLCMGQKALVVGAGGYWLATGQLQVGTFFFFLSAVSLFIWPVRMLGRILSELGKALVAIGRIGEILEHPRESRPVPAVVASSAADRLVAGRIAFEGVRFSHGNGPVLDGIDFEIEPGGTLALLGPSGSGKSTIVNLLLRFYDPEAGTIRIDGVDIARLDRKEVRRKIAVVMQEPFLYSKSLRENIRLGRKGAAEEEISEAARTACIHESILEFDRGYDTMVGERGVTLSGGQRQRVALARALVDDPLILVLDDALSAIDTETETMILEALRRRRGGHTTIVIAHRLSTLAHADRILVLDHGRVVQHGTHGSLLRADGLYKRLWRIQTSTEEEFAEDLRTAGEAAGT